MTTLGVRYAAGIAIRLFGWGDPNGRKRLNARCVCQWHDSILDVLAYTKWKKEAFFTGSTACARNFVLWATMSGSALRIV